MALWEIHADLTHRDDLFDLPMHILDMYHIFSVHVASLDTLELHNELACLKRLANLNVDSATNGLACVETQHVVVQVDVYGAVQIQVKWLIPEDPSVFPPRR